MGDKEAKEFHRIELATYLERLARQLRTGTLDKHGTKRKIPQRFGAETHSEEKKGFLVTKLSPSGSTIGDYPEADRQESTSWKKSCNPITKNLNAPVRTLFSGSRQEKSVAGSAAFVALADPG